MKIINLFIRVIFFSLFIFTSANAVTGRADVYEVTMDRLELCTDSTCDTNTVMCTSSTTIDIASVTAGAEVGSWCNMTGLPFGTTYSHYRVRVSRTFTIKGTVANVVSTDDCSTGATAATTTKYGPGIKGDGETAVNQTLVIPVGDGSTAISTQSAGDQTNDHTHATRPTGATAWCVGNASTDANSNAQCVAGNTTYSSTWATNASSGTVQIIYPFTSSWTVGLINPKMIISFNTSAALGANNMNSKCEMNPEAPTVTVTVTTQ